MTAPNRTLAETIVSLRELHNAASAKHLAVQASILSDAILHLQALAGIADPIYTPTRGKNQ